jgi:hypothetical protein
METIKFSVKCVECNKEIGLEVPIEGYFKWLDGTHIQTALPDLAPELRELLISGICPKCWDEMFADIEEDDDDEFDNPMTNPEGI